MSVSSTSVWPASATPESGSGLLFSLGLRKIEKNCADVHWRMLQWKIKSWQLSKKTMEWLKMSLKVTGWGFIWYFKHIIQLANVAEEGILHPVHLSGGAGQGAPGHCDHLLHRHQLPPSDTLPLPGGGGGRLERGDADWQSVQCQDMCNKINYMFYKQNSCVLCSPDTFISCACHNQNCCLDVHDIHDVHEVQDEVTRDACH